MIRVALLLTLLCATGTARADAPPSWTAACKTRLETAKTAFVKRHPKFASATVTAEPTRAAFAFEQDSTEYAAEVVAQKGEERPWSHPGCSEGCTDMMGQRRTRERIASYWVFVGDDAVKPDFERAFKPALDDCLGY